MKLLTVNRLRKHFPLKKDLLGRGGGTVHAVDDVSFDLEEGETLGVVGESGCGKSTAARLLVRLIEPDAGEIRLEDRLVGAEMPLGEARSTGLPGQPGGGRANPVGRHQ